MTVFSWLRSHSIRSYLLLSFALAGVVFGCASLLLSNHLLNRISQKYLTFLAHVICDNILLSNYDDFLTHDYYVLQIKLDKVFVNEAVESLVFVDSKQQMVYQRKKQAMPTIADSRAERRTQSSTDAAVIITKPLLTDNGHLFGHLTIGLNNTHLINLLQRIRPWYLLMSVLILITALVILWVRLKKITRAIDTLKEKIESAELFEQPWNTVPQSTDFVELEQLTGAYGAMLSRLSSYKQHIIKESRMAAIGKIATQVAHDLRSPLTSLKTALKYFQAALGKDPLHGDYMNLLELSLNRLNGIADGLLRNHAGEEEKKLVFSLHGVLDELVGEFSGQELSQQVKFVKEYHARAIELSGVRSKLQRAFGNVIKNALEAMKGAGTLTIKTNIEGERVLVSICDTGPGMSEETLQKVLQGGYTEGKHDGHGIGTTVVREVVNEFGGELQGISALGEGTTFIFLLLLPQSQEIVGIEREAGSMKFYTLHVTEDPIVIVDDEPSMREQWRLLLKEEECETLLCESYEDVVDKKLSGAISRTAIVDYHFDNSEKDGAEVIRYLKTQGFTKITLCTAEYWKPVVQKLAEELGAKLCPKPLPHIVVKMERLPDRFGGRSRSDLSPQQCSGQNTGRPRVLVIDDDPGIRLTWKMTKEQLGIGSLAMYASMEACESEQLKYDEIDYAFIDRRIDQSSWTLSQTIAYLKAHGVKKVIVASGDPLHVLERDGVIEIADGIAKEKIPESLEAFA